MTNRFVKALRANPLRDGSPAQPDADATVATAPVSAASCAETMVDLTKRRDQLSARVAELQWDLGGLVYEMAIRDHVKVDVLVGRAAMLQDVDSELAEVERILRTEETGSAGTCPGCAAPHSSGAVYCWQCGHALLERVPSQAIGS
jgi:hypothetical protein